MAGEGELLALQTALRTPSVSSPSGVAAVRCSKGLGGDSAEGLCLMLAIPKTNELLLKEIE